eukprot:Amastigsp_a341496_21.p5 type:complete len:136 gc:universal Amastigsp_a341496_21:780-1187(+)
MALCHDISDAHDFKHRAHRAAGDDAGTLGSRHHHDAGSTPMPEHVVVNRAVFQRHLGHVAARLFHGLLHSGWHFFRFALAHADAAITITNNRQCSEAEDTATLDDFGHAVDRDHFFLQTIVWSVVVRFCLKLSHT